MKGITPAENKKPKEFLLTFSAALVLLVIAWLGAWSNHFGNSFHFDDIPTIVRNPHLAAGSSNTLRFFSNPRTFSLTKETADYRPLLSTWFALDYRLGGGTAQAFIFQAENFAWFTAQLVVVALLFLVIPGGNYKSAIFGTFLYGLHPVMADTVNYPLQRGIIMGSFGVVAGLLLWIFWPRMLPQTLPLKLKRVPEHGFDEFLRKNYKRLEDIYLGLIHLPVALYLWPVIPALLADPAAAVFAPILLAYILIFETDRRPRHAIPAAVVCIGYWIFQTAFTFKLGEFSRLPGWNYAITQPWVAMRYLYRFFLPLHLSADTDLAPFAQFWSPPALAGYAGVAALAALAVFLSRREEWRGVGFGLWWFLIALVPYAVVPHRVVEANWRMYLPFVGLALAASRTGWIVFERLAGSRFRLAAWIGVPAAALAILILCGWGTYQRNEIWESEASLWGDVMANSPRNGRGWMNFGLTREADEPAAWLRYLERAESVSPRDALIAINLARAYDRFSRLHEADDRFRRAIADAPSWSPAYSAYAVWLAGQARAEESRAMATKAVAMDPYDLAGRRTVMDAMAQKHEWIDLRRMANETLRLYPDDPDGTRDVRVAQTGLDEVGHAELTATEEPSVDHYLYLSVQYYQSQRYEDCIKAAREALKLDPNLGEAYSNIAAAYHTMGKLDETLAALREEIRINPNLPSAQHNLNFVLAEKAKAGH